MKKVFYSEVLDKYFEDEKECRKAELQYQLEKQEKEKAALVAEAQRKEELATVSKEKKALSDNIEKAEGTLTSAQNDYQIAYKNYKEELVKLRNEYIENMKKAEETILKPASEAVKKAQQERYDAVKKFNEKYGTYTVKYTGDKAYKELQKSIEYMNNIFDKFWF